MDYSDSEFPSNRISLAPMFRMHSTYDIAPDWSIETFGTDIVNEIFQSASFRSSYQSGQFSGRLLTGNLSFGVSRVIR